MNIDVSVEEYFNHSYNQTIINERAIELVLFPRYINLAGNNLLEVGAVTPYYWDLSHDCIDPIDSKATIQGFAEDYEYGGKNVMSISTIEHIGHGDYGLEKKEGLAYEVLEKIYKSCETCFISFSVGLNRDLEDDIRKNLSKYDYFFYTRQFNLSEEELGLHWNSILSQTIWKLTMDERGFDYDLDYSIPRAHSVMFITKNI